MMVVSDVKTDLRLTAKVRRLSSHWRHSLASVELGSWAARENRRGSALQPFCSSISPGAASSRTEILQTISSSIIHLFQRKPLKDNELGILQEHVRFLINSEAGGLVQEYYKDQLLRKGMIILREKIKNEQGFELLKQLGETWDYFFKEILPILQAVLYPLTSSLSKDETVRSLTLLAFRNIVVLKVSIKEALDSVSKVEYPANIAQMLLVLQSIQDNVFLSENQFLLEKLVARVICPYLGQRGVYEGSPDPMIKVKLKPIPFNIPNVIISDDDKVPSKSHVRLDGLVSPTPLSPRKGAFQDLGGMKKLKPVLEHVYDGGRRHSIMS
ncbi:Proline-rich protein 5 [Bulinus truncatus]|nr:Proline-rich protein 5 [Bulinus truncatus]